MITVSAHGTPGPAAGGGPSGSVTTDNGTWPSESTVLRLPVIGSSTHPRAAARSVTRPAIRRAYGSTRILAGLARSPSHGRYGPCTR